jgi:hypothetical protein
MMKEWVSRTSTHVEINYQSKKELMHELCLDLVWKYKPPVAAVAPLIFLF